MIVVSLVATAFLLTRETFLPPRFSYDGERIQGIAQGRIDPLNDESFENVAQVYRSLGLADASIGASLLGFMLALVVYAIALRRMSHLSFPAMGLLLVGLVLSAIYLGFYSKDVFVLPVVALVLVLPRSLWSEAAIVVSLLAYAGVFRTYWVIVAAGYVLFRLVLLRHSSPLRFTVWSVVFIMGVGVAIVTVLGQPADYFRLSVNLSRFGIEDSASMIRRGIDAPEPFGGIINSILAWIQFIVPIPLFSLGGAYYTLLGTLLGLVLLTTILNIPTTSGTSENVHVERAVALFGALLATQALFEPDFGSFLRHLTPLLPLAVIVWGVGSRKQH
ncbi:hypothetical protein GCM10023152_26040 [Agromyces bauzanensis]|uniref:Uncharacterized protein n=1 Tax=Agromyces bauzanensis TaxID=1308924 RepID=A0A917PSJ8_9MICO|nr:hypothetical protein GCM10011372_30830 [Agromyces bauzanensis]